MDFFERQDQARTKTRWLVFYFIIATALTVLCVYLLLAWIGSFQQPPELRAAPETWWRPELFLLSAIGTLFVIGTGSIYKISQLSGGGGVVARALGGRLVSPQTTDLDERKLLNVVEEMSIASGTPVPEVYVMDHEMGINAFAAGYSTEDAAIGVTRGCMTLMTRDELQGVIAHEFSHILNGDMRLNLRLIGVIHGIVCLAIIGYYMLRFSPRTASRNRKGANPLPLIGLGLILIGSIGMFFGRLIKSAVSRQREYLADAAAVQFTRNPEGLAGALKKIGGLVYGSKLNAPNAEEASHMFFSEGVSSIWSQMMATHPPLEKRIRLLEPHFNGAYPKVTLPDARPKAPPPISPRPAARRPPMIPVPVPGADELLGRRGAAGVPAGVSAMHAVAQSGTITPAHLQAATRLRDSLPASLLNAAHEPFDASALIFGLLMSSEAAVREKQLGEIRRANPALERAVRQLEPELRRLENRQKLPLVDITLTALRQLSWEQFQQFSETIRRLVEADGSISLFEYTLQKIFLRHLKAHFIPPRHPAPKFHSIDPLAKDGSVVLSTLAYVGHGNREEAERAFAEGVRQLGGADRNVTLLPPSECGLVQVDRALDRLNEAAPQVKKRILAAAASVVSADGVLHEREAELLRALADSLDVPMPPLE
jgi:Zn-dependent protease with chaperone function